MLRVYGLNLDELETGRLRVLACADLIANLPSGSIVWRRLNLPAAWTPAEYLMALQVDQMNMWMWANGDPKKRGKQPEPIPRPGKHSDPRDDADATNRDGHEQVTRTIKVEAMTVDQLDAFMRQDFQDQDVREQRPTLMERKT